MTPLLQRILAAGAANTKTAAEFMALWVRWDLWRQGILAFMQEYDAILAPVAATPAVAHGTAFPMSPAYSYALTYTLTASPAVTVRAGTSPEGLPIGVQIVPHFWREDVALALAQQIEEGLGGWQAPPI